MTVDEFMKVKVPPQHRDLAAAIRRLMRDLAPDLHETIGHGIPAWKGRRILVVMNPTKKDITLAFARGAEFEDKHGLLRGAGNVSRHLNIKKMADLDPAVIGCYVKQAIERDAK